MKKFYIKFIPILSLTMLLQSCTSENITSTDSENMEIIKEIDSQNKDEKLQIGDEINGFKIENIQKATSINADAITFKHMKTGAEVVWLKNDDTQLQLYTLFKSKAEDNKGIPHVFEHAMFGGSEKYPTTQAVSVALSLDVNVNAMTNLASTIYTAGGYNTDTLQGLLDFWFQAAFNPNEKFLEQSLKREGYRLVMDSPEDDLKITGAVYNEIRSLSTSQIIRNEVNKSLFPDTSTKFTMGLVDEMLLLNTSDLEEFRQKYFVPSNTSIVMYGDFEYLKILSYLDEMYSPFDKVDIDVEFGFQPAFDQELIKQIEISSNEDIQVYALASNKIGDEYFDTSVNTLSEILSEYKVFNDKVTQKFGTNVELQSLTQSTAQSQNVLLLKANNKSKQNAEQFKDGIIQILNEIIEEGIDRDFLNSFLDRKILESYQNNDILGSTFIEYVLYGSPVSAFNKFEIYEDFKSKINDNFFENLINDFILNNKHASLITFVANPNLNNQENDRRANQLLEYRNSLTKEQIDEIVRQSQQYNEMQQKYSDVSSFKDATSLKYEDVKKFEVNMKDFEEKKLDGNVTVLKTNNTNISQMMNSFIYFDASAVNYEDTSYVLLLKSLLETSKFDTDTTNQAQNENLKNKYGISYKYTGIQTDIKNNGFKPYFQVRFASNLKNLEDSTLHINDILRSMKFDAKNLKDSLDKIIQIENNQYYMNKPTIFALLDIAQSKLNKSIKFNLDASDKYIKFLQNLDIDLAIQKLEEISQQIFVKNNATLVFSGDIDNPDFDDTLAQSIFKDLPERSTNEYYSYSDYVQLSNQSIYFPSNDGIDNYMQSLPNIFEDYKKMAMFDLALKIILNEYFDEVRGKNGAYGPNLERNQFYGISAGAFMDPDFLKTRQVILDFPNKIDNIRNISDEDFKKAQSSAAFEYVKKGSQMDNGKKDIEEDLIKYMENFYFSGFKKQDLKNMFESMFEFTKEDIANLSQEFQQMIDKSTISLFTSEQKIKDNADILN